MEIKNAKDVTEWLRNVSDELNWAFIVAGSVLYNEDWAVGCKLPITLSKNGVDKIFHLHGLIESRPRSLSGIRDYYFKCQQLGQYIRDSHGGVEWVTGDVKYPALIAFLNSLDW